MAPLARPCEYTVVLVERVLVAEWLVAAGAEDFVRVRVQRVDGSAIEAPYVFCAVEFDGDVHVGGEYQGIVEAGRSDARVLRWVVLIGIGRS